MKSTFLGLLAILCGVTGHVQALNVSGPVTTTTWTKANSPYRVIGTITVPPGVRLTIEPGVDVLFDADVQFVVQGSLKAIGTEADSIRFIKGTAAEWGGIRISGGDSSTIVYARISGGNANGGGESNNGGGIHITGTGTGVGIAYTVISSNSASASPSGTWVYGGYGGGIYANGTLTLIGCRISGNSASASGGYWVSGGNGGGIYANGTLTLIGCRISGNSASASGGSSGGNGGGMYTANCKIALTTSVLSANSSVRGAAIDAVDGTNALTLSNCTVVGNIAASNSAGIHVGSNLPTLVNCIVWGDTPRGILGTVKGTYCDIQDGLAGKGNIRATPLFVDPANGDFHLTSWSPCIDAGDPGSPPDPDGSQADMGAFPYSSPLAWVSRPDTTTAEARRLTFTVSATHREGLPLSYRMVTAPVNATFDTTARVFDWTPDHVFVKWPNTTKDTAAVFTVTDGAETRPYTVHITVSNANRLPVWSARPDTTTAEGVALTLTVAASDSDIATDGQTLTYTMVAGPRGAVFTPGTRVFAWTPDYAQAGDTLAIFNVFDGIATASDTVLIVVTNVNGPPAWAPRSDTLATARFLLTFTVSATDPDGEALSYGASALPSGATFDVFTRLFRWVPTNEQLGDTTAAFSVTDGDAPVLDTVQITVLPNRPPVWAARADTSTSEMVTLTFTVLATDPDGHALVYSATKLPQGAAFDAATRTFAWTPDYTQAGDTLAAFSVTDGDAVVRDTLNIHVENANRPPEWVARPDTSTTEGVRLAFTISATDPDGDALTYSMAKAPVGASFAPSTRVFAWAPDYTQAGDTVAVFSVGDGTTTVLDTVAIHVADVNRPPGPISIIGDTTSATRSLAFRIQATDPDGDVVRYRLLTSLDGAALDTLTGQFVWSRRSTQAENQTVTLSASDGVASVTRVVGIRAAAANVAPTVAWSEALRDTVSWDAACDVTVSDAEGDSARLVFWLSTDGGASWHPATVSGASGPIKPPANVSLTWDTRADLPGKALWPSVTLRLVPMDEDSGEAGRDTVCVLNLPCDWDRDGKVGFGDFVTLRNAWTAQDTTRNLGPYAIASGDAIPNIVPTQDRRIDFEDLMAFSILWDWALGKGRVARIGHLLAKSSTGSADAPVRFVVDGDAILVTLGVGIEADAVGLSIAPPGDVHGLRFERGDWCGSDGWWLSWVDTTAGLVETWAASSGERRGDRTIGRLVVPTMGREVGIAVAYEMRLSTGESVTGSYTATIDVAKVPTTWSLGPVAPNPFNPSTVVAYGLPAAAHVRLEVFDLVGRTVAVLVDDRQEAGRYRVTWSGCDANHRPVASGLYVVSLRGGQTRLVERVILLR